MGRRGRRGAEPKQGRGAEPNQGRLCPVLVARVLRVLGVVVLLPLRVLLFFVLRLPRVLFLRVLRAPAARGRFARLCARAGDAVEERGRGERQEENDGARRPCDAEEFAGTPRKLVRGEGILSSHQGKVPL